MTDRYEQLKGQVIWAVNHYGIVETDGIFIHLRNVLEELEQTEREEKNDR